MYVLSREPTLSALLKVSSFEDRRQVLSRHGWGLLGTWNRVEEPSKVASVSPLNTSSIHSVFKGALMLCHL